MTGNSQLSFVVGTGQTHSGQIISGRRTWPCASILLSNPVRSISTLNEECYKNTILVIREVRLAGAIAMLFVPRWILYINVVSMMCNLKNVASAEYIVAVAVAVAQKEMDKLATRTVQLILGVARCFGGFYPSDYYYYRLLSDLSPRLR